MAQGTGNFSKAIMTAVGPSLERYYGGGQILWVGNRSGLPSGDGSRPTYPLATLFGTSGALAKLNATTNRGHVIFVLPGHAESISSADHASAGGAANCFAIVGLGRGTARPTFTWTTATSTWLLDTANVWIDNCNLYLAGAHATGAALTVAAPFTVSAPGCGFRRNSIWAGFEDDRAVTIGITTTADANQFTFGGKNPEDGNIVRGDAVAGATLTTTFLRIVGGDSHVIANNDIIAGTSSAAVGPIQNLTTAATNSYIADNSVQNNAASSTACITWALASSTGWIARNNCRNMTDGSFAHLVVTSGDMQLFANNGVNNSNESNRVLFLGTASA